MPKKPFKGVIKLDIRDSKPDWEPFTLPQAPEGAPNILIVLYDDTGLAAWSPFGGRIQMPTLQKLTDERRSDAVDAGGHQVAGGEVGVPEVPQLEDELAG